MFLSVWTAFFLSLVKLCQSDTQFSEEIQRCSTLSLGFTSSVTNTTASFSPSYFAKRNGTRSEMECALHCRRQAVCTSAYYEDNTGLCYLSQESYHDMESQGRAGKEGENLGSKIRIGNFISNQDNTNNKADSSTECTNANCADGGQACVKDCTNNVGVCVAPYKECDEIPVANIRHYYYKNYRSGSDNAALLTRTFKKQYSFTSLRVRFRGIVRAGYNCGGCCVRWYFTFNDQECSSPGKIEIVWYKGKARDDYRPANVDGICDLPMSGDIVVKFRIGTCSGYNVVDGHTGWNGNGVSMTVEENDLRRSFDTNLPTYGGNAGGSSCTFPFVYKGMSYSACIEADHNQPWCATTSNYDNDGRWGQCPGTCPKLSRFNIKQYTWTGVNGADNGHIYTYYYYKRASDTAIRVLFHSTIYIYKHGALRYFIRFDGHDCTSPGLIDGIYSHSDSNVVDHTHDGTGGIEGLCDNIAAGRRSIQIHIARKSGSIDGYTGWNARSKIIVEEIRYDLDISAVVTRDGSIQRLPEYNFHQWRWWAVNNGIDSGHVGAISVTYTKKSSQSMLAVQYSGNLRQYESSYSTPGCSRWYLTFNGAECSTPGPISTLVYQRLFHRTDNVDDNQHHASIFGGYCELPAGSYNIRLYVQTCPGHSYNNAYTGWESSSHLLVNEVFPVD